MERDEETGFNYHGARYYALWLGRWASADPIGLQGGLNLFVYAKNNCICLVDLNGTDPLPFPSAVKELLDLVHERFSEYSNIIESEMGAGGSIYPRQGSSQELGQRAGAAVQKWWEGVFGEGSIEFKFDPTEHNFSFDLRAESVKLNIDLKLTPDAESRLQKIATTDWAARKGEAIAHVYARSENETWWGANWNKMKEGALRNLRLQFQQLKASQLSGDEIIAARPTTPSGKGRGAIGGSAKSSIIKGGLAVVGVLGAIPSIKQFFQQWSAGERGAAIETAGWTAASFYPPTMPVVLAKGASSEFDANREAIEGRGEAFGEMADLLFAPPMVGLAAFGGGEVPHTPIGATVAAGWAVTESTGRAISKIPGAVYEGASILFSPIDETIRQRAFGR
jgi:RHS repeat-associated protein